MNDILGEYYKKKEKFNHNKSIEFEYIISRIKEYLLIYDIDFNTHCLQLFDDLYSNKSIDNLYKIASKNNLDIKSLYNYRKRFNQIAEKLLHLT